MLEQQRRGLNVSEFSGAFADTGGAQPISLLRLLAALLPVRDARGEIETAEAARPAAEEQSSRSFSGNVTKAVPDLIQYDGTCGVCHWWVVFLIKRDEEGRLFRFQPLRQDSPTVIVTGEDGRRYTRSDAVIYLLRRLGGGWRLAARLMAVAPGRVRDRVYDLIAAVRYRLAARRTAVCPVLPAELRSRFVD